MRLTVSSILFFLFLFSEISFGQAINNLSQLDSLAFDALENNKKDVTLKANELLSAGQAASSSVHVINAYTILGIVAKNKGHYVTAVDFYKEALSEAEKSEDEGRISACYNNIGSVYQIQDNYSKALEYFKKSLSIEERLNNPLQKSIRLYNIGDMYRELDSLTLALTNFNSSLLIEKEYKNQEGIAYALLGVADVYLRLEKPTDARISIDEARSIVQDTGVEAQILYNILKSELLYQEGVLDEALELLQNAKELSDKNEYKVHLVDIYEKEISIKKAKEKLEREDEDEKDSNTWLWIIIPVISVLSMLFALMWKLKNKSVSKSNGGANEKQSIANNLFRLQNDSGKVLIEVDFEKIIIFEASDNYVVTYYLSDDGRVQKSVERSSLKKIEELINESVSSFFRVHKSYIVNQEYIESINGKAQAYKLKLSYVDNTIPVSRTFDISRIKG